MPCQFEFDYSLRRKGVEKMIPVVMEETCLDTSKWQARARPPWLTGALCDRGTPLTQRGPLS